MQVCMTRYALASTAAALLTGCVPSVDPEQFEPAGRQYGETVGLTLDQPTPDDAQAASPDTIPFPQTAVSNGTTSNEPSAVSTVVPSDPPGEEAPVRGAFTEDELAYLVLLFEGAGMPFDLGGEIPPDNDGDGIPNIIDEDVDGDGIPNGEDDDVDGDGEPNGEDEDTDGDGINNDDDPDIDGDGESNDVDADDDGDGLSDRWDLNDDGDGTPDDEDDDNEDDEPSDTLEDLVDGLDTITDRQRDRIALEIADRLNDPIQQANVRALIDALELQAVNPNRARPDTEVPPAIHAIDQLYRQLGDAIEDARRSQPNPRGVLLNTRMQAALSDFIDRGTAMKRLGAIFPAVSLDVASDQVADLRSAFSGDRLEEIATRIGAHVRPEARGSAEDEQRELEQIGKGASSLGRVFQDEDPEKILEGVDRLRALADRIEDQDERDAFYDDLVRRVDEGNEEGASIDDFLDEIEMENEVDDQDNP